MESVKCQCGSVLERVTIPEYDFTATAGYPYVLHDVEVLRCPKDGRIALDGPVCEAALDQLALTLAESEERLDSDGARYLRKRLGSSQRGLAERLVEACARAAHEANRAYCLALGDDSQVAWDAAPAWVRESGAAGVRGALDGATPAQTHEAWCAHKRADGWVFGPVKDAAARTHPCLVSYAELPEAQKRKDAIYLAVVRAMAAALETP